MAKTDQKKAATSEETEELDLPERYHSPGCPMDPDRLEWHETVMTTNRSDIPAGTKVEVIRCADCGGQIEKPVTD